MRKLMNLSFVSLGQTFISMSVFPRS
jgi:hypothetical protein